MRPGSAANRSESTAGSQSSCRRVSDSAPAKLSGQARVDRTFVVLAGDFADQGGGARPEHLGQPAQHGQRRGLGSDLDHFQIAGADAGMGGQVDGAALLVDAVETDELAGG